MGRPRKPLAERFWAFVERGAPDECWLWRGGVQNSGYGVFSYRGEGVSRSMSAHRQAFLLEKGHIPSGLIVRQRCGNKLCCNSVHLETRANSKLPFVPRMNKLTDEQVRSLVLKAREFREWKLKDWPMKLALEYGISEAHARRIADRKRKAHVFVPEVVA